MKIMLTRLHYRLMAQPRYWYRPKLKRWDARLCRLMSWIRKKAK
jgi:hypothetical protein